jgi:hypothetical protein
MPLVNLVNSPRVRVHGLLLEVPDEAVDDLGGDEVGDEEAVEEDALRADDHGLHKPAGLAHLHKGEKVHALVVALLEEGLDPAVVAAHAAEAVEVAEHAAHHAWDAGYAFEEDEADELGNECQSALRSDEEEEEEEVRSKGAWLASWLAGWLTYPLCFGQGLLGHNSRGGILPVDLLRPVHARRLVHPEAREPHNLPRGPVAEAPRGPMGGDDGLHLLHGVPVVGPRGGRGLDVRRVLGREEVAEMGGGRGGEASR